MNMLFYMEKVADGILKFANHLTLNKETILGYLDDFNIITTIL